MSEKLKDFCVYKKMAPICLQEKEIYKKYKDFQFSLINKSAETFKMRDVVKNVCEKIAKNLDFVENSNFIRGSTEAAALSCSGVNSQKNTHGGALLV